MAWNVTEDGETDVDEQVSTAAGDHEDAHRRDKDSDEDYQEGGGCVRHCVVMSAGRLENSKG